jgi:hypothetical protein
MVVNQVWPVRQALALAVLALLLLLEEAGLELESGLVLAT